MIIAVHTHEIEYQFNVVQYPRSYCLVVSTLTDRAIFQFLKYVGSLVGSIISGPVGCGKRSLLNEAAALCGNTFISLSWNILNTKQTFDDIFVEW